jgi:sigma-B regulation protein RsbU (phosphoserine phosphatase)
MSQSQLMQCMEVWGGNQPTDSGVVLAGLDAWVYSKPYRGAIGGGDVYYVSSCATGRIVRLLVADVSGHGQAVSDAAIQLRALMRQYVNHLDQTRFVDSLNKKFSALAQAGSFATAVVTTFFAPTKRLTLCNAGHPPPLLYRARTRQWTYLRHDGPSTEESPANLPLGVIDLADYQCFDVTLGLGDLVLCYSDALIEARSAGGEFLGSDGLLEIIQSLDPAQSGTLVSRLLDAIAARTGGELGGDDVTLLLFRPNGLGLRRPLLDRLLGPVRVLGGVWQAMIDRSRPFPWPDLRVANVGGAIFAPLERLWKPRGED